MQVRNITWSSVRIVGKVRFVYARCDADASYLAYKGLTCRF